MALVGNLGHFEGYWVTLWKTSVFGSEGFGVAVPGPSHPRPPHLRPPGGARRRPGAPGGARKGFGEDDYRCLLMAANGPIFEGHCGACIQNPAYGTQYPVPSIQVMLKKQNTAGPST